jgi:hypothetical protein
MVLRPLAYSGRHSVICQGTLPDMPQSGKYRRSLVVAKSAESGEPVFASMDVLLYELSLRRPIFEQKRVRDH